MDYVSELLDVVSLVPPALGRPLRLLHTASLGHTVPGQRYYHVLALRHCSDAMQLIDAILYIS